MDDPLSAFLKELTASAVNSTTERNYRTDIRSLLALAAEHGEAPHQVTRGTVRAWLRTRNEAGVSRATVRRQLSAVRSFFSWMVRTDQMVLNPTAEIRGPRREWKLPRVLSLDEASRLLDLPSSDSPADLRCRAMLEVLYGTAMRSSEMRGLNLGDIALTSGLVFIRNGKGPKDRLVPMGVAAIRALRAWLPRRARLVHDFGRQQDAVFINFRDGGRLDGRSIARVVLEAGRRAGLKQTVHPHMLRHSCATHLLDGGAPLEQVKELLGHESIATTQIYTRLAMSRLRKVIEERHPRG